METKKGFIEYVVDDFKKLMAWLKEFDDKQYHDKQERLAKENAELDQKIEQLKKKAIIAKKRAYVERLEDEANGNTKRKTVIFGRKPEKITYEAPSMIELNRRSEIRYEKLSRNKPF